MGLSCTHHLSYRMTLPTEATWALSPDKPLRDATFDMPDFEDDGGPYGESEAPAPSGPGTRGATGPVTPVAPSPDTWSRLKVEAMLVSIKPE